MTRTEQRLARRYIKLVPTDAQPRSYLVRLEIGFQGFNVSPADLPKNEALWYRRMLAHALCNLIEENIPYFTP